MGQQPVLNTLRIKNFAIIDDLELSFAPGLTVFTGETGAGKSIIVDALSLALGARGDSSLLREGCEQCVITAAFSCDEETYQQLQQLQFDSGEEIIIRRVISRNSGSRCYLNDQQVTLNTIRTTTARLAAIQGQHAYRTLQNKEQHLSLLDKHGGIDTGDVRKLYRQLKQITDQLQQLQDDANNTGSMELVNYQCQELDQLMPVEGEYEQLDQEHRQMANSDQLRHGCAEIIQGLEGDAGIVATGAGIVSKLRAMAATVPEFNDLAEQMDSAVITMQETSRELTHKFDKISLDPEKLQQMEHRIQTLHELARKHKVQPPELPQLHRQLQDRLAQFNNIEDTMKKLQQQQQQAMADYQEQSQQLNQARQAAAEDLERKVATTLHELGMKKSSITVKIEATRQPTATGSDEVELYAQINPGVPAKPLAKTASGGELSRICLAIHSHNPEQVEAGTVIFDEIDTGTGGDVAGKIARLMRAMSSTTQVFCITHQAQIAAAADQHYKVEKEADHTTRVKAVKLDDQQRETEIARMLAGAKITKQSREHARQMLGTLAAGN